jgi:ribosome-interacting GTPase 1
LPGIIEGAASGKGRGREVIAVARSADLIMMVLDGAREQNNQHRDILTRELETMGIRLNRKPPGIYFKRKATGGIKFNATCPLTQMGDNPSDAATRILGSYRIHNAEVLFREDCSLDDLIGKALHWYHTMFLICIYRSISRYLVASNGQLIHM